MLKPQTLEKQFIQQLKKENVCSETDQHAVVFSKKAQILHQQGKFLDAAAYYAALATVIPQSITLSLQAARYYQKGNALDAAASWYLSTAERYALNYQVAKSIAILRIYSKLKPNDKVEPKRIYALCLRHGADEDNPPSLLLSDADMASNKLLANDFFRSLNPSSMEYLLQQLTYHKLQDGQVLAKMGEQASSLYIIISGAISGYLTLNNTRIHLGEMFENSICGETAYFTGGKRTAEMVSKGESEVFELPYTMLDKFKTELPSFKQHIEKIYRCRMLVKQLALTTLFKGVTAQSREWIAARMKPYSSPAGTTLFKQGDSSHDVYLVRQGILAVTIHMNGVDRLVRTVEVSGIVGEIAIISNKKRAVSISVVTDSVLMKLDGNDYESLYQSCPSIKNTLQDIRQKHIDETFDIMQNIKHVDGDKTCESLIKAIWEN